MQVNLTISKASIAEITIINSNGLLVRIEAVERLEEGENQIPLFLSNLPNGVYFLKILGDHFSPIVQRFIIKN